MLRFLILFILLFVRSIGVAVDTVQYGGDLNVDTVNVTLLALFWDPRDWVWKANHDAGAVREQLFVADLCKRVRNGGKYGCSKQTSQATVHSDSLRLKKNKCSILGPQKTPKAAARRNSQRL